MSVMDVPVWTLFKFIITNHDQNGFRSWNLANIEILTRHILPLRLQNYREIVVVGEVRGCISYTWSRITEHVHCWAWQWLHWDKSCNITLTHYFELQTRLNTVRNSKTYDADDVIFTKVDILQNFVPTSHLPGASATPPLMTKVSPMSTTTTTIPRWVTPMTTRVRTISIMTCS